MQFASLRRGNARSEGKKRPDVVFIPRERMQDEEMYQAGVVLIPRKVSGVVLIPRKHVQVRNDSVLEARIQQENYRASTSAQNNKHVVNRNRRRKQEETKPRSKQTPRKTGRDTLQVTATHSPRSTFTRSRRPSSARRTAARKRNTRRRMRHSPYHQSPTIRRSNTGPSPVQRRLRVRPQTAPMARSKSLDMREMDLEQSVQTRPASARSTAARAFVGFDSSLLADAAADTNALLDGPGEELRAADVRVGLRVVTLYYNEDSGAQDLYLSGIVREVFGSEASDMVVTVEVESGDLLREVPLTQVWQDRKFSGSQSAHVAAALEEATKAATARRRGRSTRARSRRRRTLKPKRPAVARKVPKPRPKPPGPAPRPTPTRRKRRNTPLQIEKIAMERQQYVNRICLCDAVARQAGAQVERLLRSKTDPNYRSFLDNDGPTPLHLACQKNDHAIVECLLDAKADPTFKDGTGLNAFLVAAQTGDAKLVGLVLSVNREKRLVNSTFPDGSTALFLAAQHNNRQLTNVLLSAKCNPTIRDNMGRVPLEIAEEHADKNMIRSLTSAIGKHNTFEQLKRQKEIEAKQAEAKEMEEEESLPEDYNYMLNGGFEKECPAYQVSQPFLEFSAGGVKRVHSVSSPDLSSSYY